MLVWFYARELSDVLEEYINQISGCQEAWWRLAASAPGSAERSEASNQRREALGEASQFGLSMGALASNVAREHLGLPLKRKRKDD